MDSTEIYTTDGGATGETPQEMDMDALVGYVLLTGVLLSMALVTAGLIWQWIDTGKLALNYRLVGMNLFQLVVAETRLTFHGGIRPRVLVNFGIVVLMLTPFIRVLSSVVYFAAFLKNWKYTLFTAIVLTVLTYSLFLR